MTYREEKYLLETVRENNKMLKEIIKYINYTISQASDENMDDFGRNILANLISEINYGHSIGNLISCETETAIKIKKLRRDNEKK